MIIEQHYDEEVLIALLDGDAPDPHLQSCETCKASLNAIRTVTSALHDGAVWDRRELNEEPRRETRDALRAFATSAAMQDAAAEPWVKLLLAKPAAEWRATVEAHPEWRTAGFVRKLIKAVDSINFTAPQDAVELTKIAVDVAERVDSLKVRALAWKEYAYALQYVGSYTPAFEAIDRCERYLESCPVNEYDRANAMLVRADINAGTEKLEEALRLSRRARAMFESFDATRRIVVAELHEAAMLLRMRRHAEALALYTSVSDRHGVDDLSRACAISNAALCARELRDLNRAKSYFADAIAAYEKLQLPAMRTKARWNFATVLMQQQQYAAALDLLSEVRADFQELGMAHDVALAAVDAAEAFLLAGQPHAVAELCREAMTYFRSAELAYTQGALTALAYLREAADAKSLTVSHVGDVRAFFEILPKQPQLLFARPA